MKENHIKKENKTDINQMEFEIANDTLSSSQTKSSAEYSGVVGGTMTKRLVTLGEKELLAKQGKMNKE